MLDNEVGDVKQGGEGALAGWEGVRALLRHRQVLAVIKQNTQSQILLLRYIFISVLFIFLRILFLSFALITHKRYGDDLID